MMAPVLHLDDRDEQVRNPRDVTMKKRLVVVFALSLLAAACEKEEAQNTAASAETATSAKSVAHSGIDIDDPQSCKGCHGTIYEEWTQSMHSRAHHDNDPIYGGMRALRIEKQGDHITERCAKCHNPRSPNAPDAPAGMAGVSCAACHNVSKVHLAKGKVGVDVLTWSEGDVMRSGRDIAPGASPVHGTGKALPAMEDGVTLCMSCHNATKTPTGAPACTTGPEFREHGGEQTCVSCHMPEVSGPAGAVGRQKKHVSHQFLGPHRAWHQDDPSILESAVEMSAAFGGDGLTVTLANKSVHGFPSGFPGRTVVVSVVGKNVDGEVIWKNFEANPMAEHPESVLNKVYHTAEGEPAPAPFAEKLVRDTRLDSDEERRIVYAVPEEVTTAQIELIYRLLPSKLAEVIGVADKPEATPRTIKTLTTRR